MIKAKVLASCVALACVGMTSSNAAVYVGVGGGVSKLAPGMDDGLETLDEGMSSGYKVVVGQRGAGRGALELYLANLGVATVTDTTNATDDVDVEFVGYGVNGMWDLLKSQPGSMIPSVFASLGLGSLQSEVDADRVKRQDGLWTSVGLGANFGLPVGLNLRTSVELFDGEALFASALISKAFGAAGGVSEVEEMDMPAMTDAEDSVMPAMAEVEEVVEELPVMAEVEEVIEEVVEAPVVKEMAKVEQLGSVYFNRDSAFLTDMAQAELGNMAKMMSDYGNLRLEIQGHADVEEKGNTRSLSELRALRVANHLVQLGVDKERLSLIAYGTTQAAAAAGSDLNRRGQFRILGLK